MRIESQVRQFIRTTFLPEGSDDLSDDASLLRSGLLDSTDQLELVLFLEGDFDITIEDGEAVADNLDTLRLIAAFVTRKQAQSSPRQDEGHEGAGSPARG